MEYNTAPCDTHTYTHIRYARRTMGKICKVTTLTIMMDVRPITLTIVIIQVNAATTTMTKKNQQAKACYKNTHAHRHTRCVIGRRDNDAKSSWDDAIFLTDFITVSSHFPDFFIRTKPPRTDVISANAIKKYARIFFWLIAFGRIRMMSIVEYKLAEQNKQNIIESCKSSSSSSSR